MSSMAARRPSRAAHEGVLALTMGRSVDFPAITQAHHDAILRLPHVIEAGDEPHADRDQDNRKHGRGEIRPHPLTIVDRFRCRGLLGRRRRRLGRSRAEFHHAVVAVGKVRRTRHRFKVSSLKSGLLLSFRIGLHHHRDKAPWRPIRGIPIRLSDAAQVIRGRSSQNG